MGAATQAEEAQPHADVGVPVQLLVRAGKGDDDLVALAKCRGFETGRLIVLVASG
mgnify:CR=1 FL=1